MQFITVRDLRDRASEIWELLKQKRELVITLNGSPIGILSATSEGLLEESLKAIRKAKAELALYSMQNKSIKNNLSTLSEEEIDKEISETRKSRKKNSK